ncbi:MAG: hypothetical protein RI973_1790 [Bacteroidota bacterium]|jgi:16S rRNA (cytosine967-C5)-methyltransferase
MKLHPLLVQAVTAALLEIFREGRYADKVIATVLRSNPKWGKRDRAFIAENVYEVVRWYRRLQELAGMEAIADGQLTVQQADQLLGVNLILKGISLPDWTAFEGLDAGLVLKRLAQLRESGERRIVQSLPDWLDAACFGELGARWAAEIEALNQPAPVVLRVNTLKTDKSALQSQLADQGWPSHETSLAPDALVLERQGNVFETSLFKAGQFEVQDAGSQCIAPFLQVEPGMRVIDACAGAGGKALHLAALMKNKGSIIALDTEERKLEELRRRARRNGVHILQTRPIDSSKVIKRLHGSADRLLLDVPCSGLGVLRRNPDAKWKLSPAFMDSVRGTQAAILRDYSRMLAPGGLMVYATCSILPSENEAQVAAFLENYPAFELLSSRNISPAEHQFDGFFMALIRKNKDS